jgi:4-diphosphocytidyl-2-C-methyl-D-erythritol kinase
MRADAFAKLTLSLRITGVRADGYHELDAVMVTVTEPHDVVTFTPGAGRHLVLEGPFVEGVPSDERNIARRAMEACGATGKLRIEKGIPSGAGLGGGSADAAAVLRLLGGDAALGARLGADVPFCMRGGAARVRGIGDIVEPIEAPDAFVVIATPPFSCYTFEVYRAWDELGGPSDPTNDLEPAAHHVEPRLRAFKDAVEAAAGSPAFLAGSGSSYALVFDDAATADGARARIAASVDGWVWRGHVTSPTSEDS